jgi:uncharacterized protein YjiS (DUF1127 family)
MSEALSGLSESPRPRALRAVANLFRAWSRRRRFIDLRHLDDHLLRDIGVTRDDLAWGASLPLREDATKRVRRRMARRNGAPEPSRTDAVNTVCPWTGRPVSSAALTTYRGQVVGFGNPDSLHEFERARSAFDSAIAARAC